MITEAYLRKWPSLKLESHAVRSAIGDSIIVYLSGRTDRIRPLLSKAGARWIGRLHAWGMAAEHAPDLFEELDKLEALGKMAAYSYDRTADEQLPEGSKALLSGHAVLSKVGFSVEVKILRWLDKPKGLRKDKQEVEVQLPDGERVTVMAGDLAKV